MTVPDISLVIFTCNGREQLLYDTINSFRLACGYHFFKIILAVDGQVSPAVIGHVKPDIVVQSPVRKGYVNNILLAIKNIGTPYFFWLEDDWHFNSDIDINFVADQLHSHNNWAQIAYSKHKPNVYHNSLAPLTENFYNNPNGFTANPMLCKTVMVKESFDNLLQALKDGQDGNEGFENFLTRDWGHRGLLCVVYELPDSTIISHEGYLESTPRNWHMINSIENNAENYLLAMPVPPFWRKLLMAVRLFVAFIKLTFRQFVNNEIYELCFRILASIKNTGKNG